MKQIELTSKLVLAIVGLTSVGAILVPTYAVPTIRSGDIFDGTILSVDIKDGEVKTADLANGAVTKEKLNPNAVKLVVVEREAEFEIPGHSVGGGSVECNSNEVVTGGGVFINGGATAYPIASSRGDDNGWTALGFNTADDTRVGNRVFAECAHLELGP
jgi:hypothetical protein